MGVNKTWFQAGFAAGGRSLGLDQENINWLYKRSMESPDANNLFHTPPNEAPPEQGIPEPILQFLAAAQQNPVLAEQIVGLLMPIVQQNQQAQQQAQQMEPPQAGPVPPEAMQPPPGAMPPGGAPPPQGPPGQPLMQ